MNFSNLFLLRGAVWTISAYLGGQILRLGTNVLLARLLAPEVFGLMTIVNSIRTGIDLLCDLGISQNIVQNPKADRPEFLRTAWTLRLLRGVALFLIMLAVATPIADLYAIPILQTILPVAGLFFVITAFGSLSLPLLQKKLRFVRLNLFEFLIEVVSSCVHVILAIINPTVWALVFGGLTTAAIHTAGTYVITTEGRPRFNIHSESAREILHFSKWIFLASILYFASTNFDRLYLGKVFFLELLGVYGIARALSELVSAGTSRFAMFIVFPMISASHGIPRADLKSAVRRKRMFSVGVSAVGLALAITISDQLIHLLYDERYSQAVWMLPLLLVGSWFSVLSSLGEAVLLGFGKTSYGAFANATKLLWLLVALPISFQVYGPLGAILVIASADFWRYAPIAWGQFREGVNFIAQDIGFTAILVSLIISFQMLRQHLGLETILSSLPALH